MALSGTATPATACAVKPAFNCERFAGELTNKYTHSVIEHQELQAFRLKRRFGFAFETAVVIASLAWGVAR